MKKKILILHTSVGLGHQVIAQNIAWNLGKAGFEVKLADIGKVQKGNFEKIVVGIHQFINKYLPFVWGWIYNWGHYIILPFRLTIAGFNSKGTLNLLNEFRPDLVITTQTSASAVIAYLKKKNLYRGKFAIAFSDYHLHAYWMYEQADFYLANTGEQKLKMVAKGISADKIFVCGITLLSKVGVDTLAVRQKLGIVASEKIVLIGTGSLGLGFKEIDLMELARLENVKIIFVCGRNEPLLARITKLHFPNLIPLGFYEPMADLYSVADIFIGKPGGLSTAEALQWQLPLLVAYTLPGQEDENLKFLVARNLVIPRPKNINEAVKLELQTHEFKGRLSENSNVGEIIGREGVLVESIKGKLKD